MFPERRHRSLGWHADGSMKRVLLGDEVDIDVPMVNITEPVGSIKDPGSKISPFKFMEGTMAVDLEHRRITERPFLTYSQSILSAYNPLSSRKAQQIRTFQISYL